MTDPKFQQPIPRQRLVETMSEVISLREKVAQAELASQAVGRARDNIQQVALPEK